MIGTLLGVLGLGAVLKWLFTPLPLAVLACTMATIYYLMTKDYGFWKARGVPGPTPTFPYGNEFGRPMTDLAGFGEWIYNTQGGKKFCGYDVLKAEMKRTGGEIELKDCFGRFTMDNIASCAFGVNCNSFKDPNTEFANNAAKLFEEPTGFAAVRLILLVLLGNAVQKILPDPLKPVNRFFSSVIKRTINERQTSNQRKDFLQLLLDTKDKNGKRVLTDSSIIAQSVLLFIVGYDTTATLLMFAAYCLATNPKVQEGIHAEIDEVLERHEGQLTYEALGEMQQLDRAISETLRLYPPAARIERLSSKEYTLPETNVTIPKGTVVQMPIFTLHRDPDHYPDPMRFDPDRFLPEEKEKRHPCAYIPFGSGPCNCVAMRFALFEAKVALAAMLRETRLEPGPNTPKPPMPLDKRAFLLTPEGKTVFLRATSRDHESGKS
ncbi:probable cytochrome P450 6a13 [Amphibalanus amphitrite]|uniref:probable cytochrome P450 6a13 n=1 Tax=Amphibalanus amphitrite TaxID=1232801 RepID=UPI001C90DE44|nr:probable cytochrome P450 6a13 [Amphibalanus amphitrite]